jgi:4-alpha-glucanotransferase
MLFERDGEGRFRPPENYPAEALATFSTHDLPTYQGWLTSHDLRVKRGLGLDPGEEDGARAWAQACLRNALAGHGHPPDDIAGIAAFLAATPARLVVMSIEDVLGLSDQVNIPGTVEQHPNWRRKLPVALEELDSHDGLRRVGDVLAQAGRAIK